MGGRNFLCASVWRRMTRLLALLFLLVVSASAQSVPPDKARFHLFLLVGQSNMAGRGTVELQDKTPHPRVLMLSKSGEWVPAIDPLHFDKPAAGVGLGKTFGQLYADAHPEVTVGLIPCAVGGSPIDSWKPGEYYPPTKSHPWDDAMLRAQIALKAGTLKGILWHQGESDSTEKLAPAYEAKLHDLVARLRAAVGTPETPFIAGQMGKFAEVPWDAFKTQVDAVHQALATQVKHAAFVSAEGLHHRGDKVHFDSASYRELGKRYFAAWQKLESP